LVGANKLLFVFLILFCRKILVAQSTVFLKILLYTDLTLRPDQLFWHRDLGLLTKAFRDLGHNALLVVHPAGDTSSNIKNPKSNIQDDPVLWVSQQDVLCPCWWKDHHPDLVILGLWTRPKYDPIRLAALSATPHIIERADSDGMRTASCGLLIYAKRRFDYFRDRTYHWPSLLSIPASIFYSFASILATPWIETRLARTLKLLPAIAVETPHATTLWKSLARRLGSDPEKIHCVPHPIQTDIFKFDPAVPKKNQIISVGRWGSYQKNLPLLLKTLRAFLDKNPTWSSLVIGSGLPTKSPHPRITFLPPLSPSDLARHMQESKIFLFSSRYESFLMSGVEALFCGCAVVGPSEIPVLGNDPLPPKNSFGGSTFNLLAQKIFIASIPKVPAASLLEASRPCSPITMAQRILLIFA
jgi:glycosyltransferase involved in cell wall biosynthesis